MAIRLVDVAGWSRQPSAQTFRNLWAYFLKFSTLRGETDMEHRYSQRVDVDLMASIYKRGVLLGTGRIKNGSRHGMYVETSVDEVNILQKLVLEVVIYPAPQDSRCYRLNTIVVRKSMEGLGLELEGIDDQDTSMMAELLSLVVADYDHRVTHSKAERNLAAIN
jgi:hypothetical protein